MKKLLGIVVLGLLLSGNAYAKAYKVKLVEQNEFGSVFKISLPMLNDTVFQWENAFKKTRKLAIENCRKNNKTTFAFWSQKYGWYSRDKNGNFFSDDGIANDIFGINQDMHEKILTVRPRYFCADDYKKAYDLLKNFDDIFKKKFKSNLNYSKILYSNIEQSPYDFKSLDGSEVKFSENIGKKELKSGSQEAKLEEFKKICENIGYNPGTDKFADCTLKLVMEDKKQPEQKIDWGKVAGEFDPKYKDNNKRVCKKRKPTGGMTQDVGDTGVTEIITCEDQ